ncbi:MAG: phage virion morphogenesis protein [Magnetococcales bacterium]|nr:phage virion morphogenesis protein [Magnetococcales bacterium]
MSDPIEIKIDDLAVMDALNRLSMAASNAAPAMREVAGVLADDVEGAFEREVDPVSGVPWPELRPSTIQARQKKGKWPGKILQVTGLLAASVASDSGPFFARVGSNRRYAAIHQLGGTIPIYARSQQVYFKQNARTGVVGNRFVKKSQSNFAQWATRGGHEIRIPARPYLGLSPEGGIRVVEILTRHLLGVV